MNENPEHDELRNLVLAWEELAGAERVRADGHLATCAECRALLDRVRRIEQARPVGALPPLEDATAYVLDDVTRMAADRSLEALLGRVHLGWASGAADGAHAGAGPSAPGAATGRGTLARPSPFAGRARQVLAALAAAACLVAVALLWPRTDVVPALLTDARIAPYSGARGVEPGPWHTGDAFVIELDLRSPARLVVFHVDPLGEISLLHPRDPGLAPALSPAGTAILPAAGVEWRLEGEAGPETFVVVAIADADLARRSVSAGAHVAPGERSERIRALVALLERSAGPVRTLEIQHLP